MAIEWVYPWVLLLLPLPILVYFLVPEYRKIKDALRVPYFEQALQASGLSAHRGGVVAQQKRGYLVLLTLTWGALVLALAKPQELGAPVSHERSARDLMVAVDLSASMEAKDFLDERGVAVDRLQAVKSVLGEFVENRPHDRLGLIVFGDAAFLQAPFTQDHRTWLTLLEETEIGMAGSSTALGDAMGLAIKLFRNNDSKNRVLIVLTDGNDTGSLVPPIDAAKVAKEYGVTVYPIAIGDALAGGEEALDVETLSRIADETNGVFYQADDRVALSEIYSNIAKLEPEVFETLSYRPRSDLFHYPLGFALLFLMLALLLQFRTELSQAKNSQSKRKQLSSRESEPSLINSVGDQQ